MRTTTKTVAGQCPLCGALVPIFTLTATVRGWLRPKLALAIQSDASDYVAHMWGHSQQEPSWR